MGELKHYLITGEERGPLEDLIEELELDVTFRSQIITSYEVHTAIPHSQLEMLFPQYTVQEVKEITNDYDQAHD